MAVGWFISTWTVEYDIKGIKGMWRRTERFRELVQQITEDGGAWSGTEVLGNVFVAKIRASEETLSAIAALSGVQRLPKARLSDPLSDLTVQQRNAIVNKLTNMGYPLQEIRDNLGNNINNRTLGDVLRFASRRKLTPHIDEASGLLVVDGAERVTTSVDAINDSVADN